MNTTSAQWVWRLSAPINAANLRNLRPMLCAPAVLGQTTRLNSPSSSAADLQDDNNLTCVCAADATTGVRSGIWVTLLIVALLVGATLVPFVRAVLRVHREVRRMGATPGMVARIMFYHNLLRARSILTRPCAPIAPAVLRLRLLVARLCHACCRRVATPSSHRDLRGALPEWSRELITPGELTALQSLVRGHTVVVYLEEEGAPVGLSTSRTFQLSFLRAQLRWHSPLSSAVIIQSRALPPNAYALATLTSACDSVSTPGCVHLPRPARRRGTWGLSRS